MDELLLGYASSGDDVDDIQPALCANGTKLAADDSNNPAQIKVRIGRSEVSSAQDVLSQHPSKRQKLLDNTADGAHSAVRTTMKPAGRNADRPRAAHTTSAACPPGTAESSVARSLPNPLALLEASNDDERHSLVATTAAPRGGGGGVAPPAPATRVRTFPHVVGNFPTVVLLPVQGMDEPLDALYRKVRRLLPDLEPMAQEPGAQEGTAVITTAPSRRGTHQRSSTSPPEGQGSHRGYHISLSRTAAIRYEQIAPLTSALGQQMRATMESAFRISLAGLRSFVNDEGTRSFVSVMVTQGSEEICSLIRGVDVALQQHRLPPFYQVPLPHVSVGWLPGDQRGRVDAALARMTGTVAQPVEAEAGAGMEAGARPVVAAGETMCSWQASRAVCVVGQREYEVWKPPPPP